MTNKVQYDQNQVNNSLENTFNIEAGTTEKQSIQSETKPKRKYSKKAPSRGGARIGAGRPKGSTNKITIIELMNSMENVMGMDYGARFAINYQSAIDRGDWGLVKEYDKAILPKLVADKLETDITSNGQTMGVQLVFTPVELPEWKQ
jgi:hypothetical protein